MRLNNYVHIEIYIYDKKVKLKNLKIINTVRTYAHMEHVVGPSYTFNTSGECEEICLNMIQCMAYTYEVV